MTLDKRRRWVLRAVAVGATAGVAGCGEQSGQTPSPTAEPGDTTPTEEPAPTPTETPQDEEPPEPGERITSARRVSPRDMSATGYKTLYTYRKRRSLEVLLSEPRVNEVASGFIATFEAYDPLTNGLDAISLQGTTDMTVEGSLDEGKFSVTATDRQVAYGLVDRRTDELVALTVTDPMDISWTRGPADEQGAQRHRAVLADSRVQEVLDGQTWYPLVKVAEIITAYEDRPLRAVTPVAYVFIDEGKLSLLSVFLDVSDPENLEVLDVNVVRKFVEFPPQEMARAMTPVSESVLGKVPGVPQAQRPMYTALDGFHNIDEPETTFEQNSWQIEYAPPSTQGAEVTASFNGKPVFAQFAPYVTYTGYNLPLREGRSTAEWFFPEGDAVFAGDLLYWDIHSADFGGPGVLHKIDYPSTPRHAAGFRFRTHYHTGALPNAVDFHSGHRFGPYNYDIAYDFYADGVVMPVWRRQGPGYVTEFLNVREPTEIFQYYVSGWGMDITPGTDAGVEVQLFDGDEWTTPTEEFYVQGDPEMLLRVTNPDGPEAVDIPLDHQTEVVVVRPHDDEIGRATRVLDADAEFGFYHPAQYVDGEAIQGEQVFTWLLMEAPTHEMPHPAGITSFAAFTELNLQGY